MNFITIMHRNLWVVILLKFMDASDFTVHTVVAHV